MTSEADQVNVQRNNNELNGAWPESPER